MKFTPLKLSLSKLAPKKLTLRKLTPAQKEQLRRPRPFLFLLIMGLFGLPWVLLFCNGVRDRQQQAQMAVRSEAFFSQFEAYPRNASAKKFDQLGADLGFIPNDPRSLIFQIDPANKLAYLAVEESLNQFIDDQTAMASGPVSGPVSGPLRPLPPEIESYLRAVKPALNAIQDHILASAELRWEIDIERMSDENYPFPSLVNTRNTQKLLLISAINYDQHDQHAEMVAALEASWRLNQAISHRPDTISQVSASAVSEYQAGLLRQLDGVPSSWQARLAQQAEQQSVIKGMRFDTWLQYKSLQKSLALVATSAGVGQSAPGERRPSERLSKSLSYWFSPVHYFNLTNIDTAQTAHRVLDQLNTLSFCSTTEADAEAMLAKAETAQWNKAVATVPAVLARRWKVAGDRTLALELTQKVLEAKQQAQVTGQWPKSLSNTASITCPKEHWIYQREDDNTITISLSKELMPSPSVSLHYQSE